jgi:hypothetical protein
MKTTMNAPGKTSSAAAKILRIVCAGEEGVMAPIL